MEGLSCACVESALALEQYDKRAYCRLTTLSPFLECRSPAIAFFRHAACDATEEYLSTGFERVVYVRTSFSKSESRREKTEYVLC